MCVWTGICKKEEGETWLLYRTRAGRRVSEAQFFSTNRPSAKNRRADHVPRVCAHRTLPRRPLARRLCPCPASRRRRVRGPDILSLAFTSCAFAMTIFSNSFASSKPLRYHNRSHAFLFAVCSFNNPLVRSPFEFFGFSRLSSVTSGRRTNDDRPRCQGRSADASESPTFDRVSFHGMPQLTVNVKRARP